MLFHRMRWKLAASLVVIACIGWCSRGYGQAAAQTFEVGQTIDAREGDVWSAVTVVAREGRRYQVRYEDGTEEWVTPDRLRAASSSIADSTPPAPAQPPGRPTPKAPAFKPRDQVEIKWGGSWRGGVVKQREGELYLVAYDGFDQQFHWEWLTEDRLRTPGSDVEGPDAWSQFSHKIGNDPLPKSLNLAKKALAEHKLKQAQQAKRDDGSNDPFAPPPFSQPVSEADLSEVKVVVPQLAPEGAKLSPDPAPQQVRSAAKPVPLVGGTKQSFERIEVFGVTGNSALVTYRDAPPGGAQRVSIELVNLAQSRSSGNIECDFASLPLAVNPASTLVAARSNGFHGGSKFRLDVWTPQGRALKHVISFAPYPEKRDAWHDINSIEFIDDVRLITSTWLGRIVCWDAVNAKAIWSLDTGGSAAHAISPGGKQLALPWQRNIIILDTASGDVIGSIAGAPGGISALAFSPDGTRLLAIASNTLLAWDITTGEPVTSLGLPPTSAPALSGTLVPLDAENVLVGSTVWNLRLSAPIWTYTIDRSATTAAASGRLVAILSDRSQRILASWQLPHEQAKQAIGKLQPAGSILHSGASVSIDLSGLEADEPQRQAISEHLKSQLAARQITVADGQPLRIVARVETGQSQERVYEQLHGPPSSRERQTVTVTEKITRLFVELDDQVAWETRAVSGAGHFISREQGQSIADAVQQSGRPATSFLANVTLPQVILRPGSAQPIGSSRLIPGGVSAN